ncbi:MAG: helix-turn-helix domain-containing protein [Hyphomicrobiales bacterium]|nr:helix-turn-helix domain-containing protein [Hyphomicrobiales bacterium]
MSYLSSQGNVDPRARSSYPFLRAPLRHANTTLRFEREQVICLPTDAPQVFKILSGWVRLVQDLADGRRQIVSFQGKGDYVWCMRSASLAIYAEAIEETLLICADGISKEEMHQAALQQMVEAQKHVLLLSQRSSDERVASFLLDMQRRMGSTRIFSLPMSRADFAAFVGMKIETISRCLSSLQQRGLIRLHGLRGIEIPTRATLERLLQ